MNFAKHWAHFQFGTLFSDLLCYVGGGYCIFFYCIRRAPTTLRRLCIATASPAVTLIADAIWAAALS